MSKTWCPLPWIFQAVRNNGDIRVCCQANPSKSRGLLKKDNGKVYNAARDNLSEAFNSPTLRDIRLKMLKGERPEQCIRCQKEESNGIRSRRIYESEQWKDFLSFQKAVQITDKEGYTLKQPVVYYDLRFGNRCNLKCRMCGPTDSDFWYSDHVKIQGSNKFKDSHGVVELVQNRRGLYQTKNKDYDWVDSPIFWKQIKSNAKNIKHLYIVGGEPLLIDKHYELLSNIIRHGSPGETTIEYNSNLSILPKKALELWKSFKQVRIGVSIDAYGAVNDYIRYPSQFKKIEKNLQKLDSLPDNIWVWIATTVSVYNIFYLPDLIQWKLKKKFIKLNSIHSKNPLIKTHPLHNPPHLNVKALPQPYKIQVEKKFQSFLDHFPKWLKEEGFSNPKLVFNAKSLLNSYIQYMNSEDWSHRTPELLKYTESLDKIRKQSLKDLMPELYYSLQKQNKAKLSFF